MIEDSDRRVTAVFWDLFEDLRTGHNRYVKSIQEIGLELDKIIPEQQLKIPAEIPICRYMSIEKYVWFCGQRSIWFSSPHFMQDMSERIVYPISREGILITLGLLPELSSDNYEPFVMWELWHQHVNRISAQTRISCWYEDMSIEDHLMWNTYSNGIDGIALCTNYSTISNIIVDYIADGIIDSWPRKNSYPGKVTPGFNEKQNIISDIKERTKEYFTGAYVEYENLSPFPFRKRQLFRAEKEIRFNMKQKTIREFDLLSEVFSENIGFNLPIPNKYMSEFTLKFHPDVRSHHRIACINVGAKAGIPIL